MRNGKCIIVALCLVLLCLGATGVSHAAEKAYINSIGMEFVLIPGGSFPLAGKEQRQATISESFYLGKYEVTQAQWETVMGNNPSKFKGLNNPVEQVSWNDVQEFIRRLNAREGHNRYRLPTEAEWELAAGGSTDNWYISDDGKGALGVKTGWVNVFTHPLGYTTHPVGQKKPNRYGLHDIAGNVSEWVLEWPADLPPKRLPDKLADLGIRTSGPYSRFIGYGRSSIDIEFPPNRFASYIGFRLASSLE